ncbi:hypothetical protein LV78_000620 [Actinosynnema pretiosum]|nr:hypothetical protein [Actinosynnema pretiosum]
MDREDLPRVPVPNEETFDGYEWREMAQEFGWVVPGLWGREGWDLGAWPLIVVGLHDDPKVKVWAYVVYIEGDIFVHTFDDEDERDRAVTAEAVFWWRNGDADGPMDLPEQGDYLEHHHGPFRGF